MSAIPGVSWLKNALPAATSPAAEPYSTWAAPAPSRSSSGLSSRAPIARSMNPSPSKSPTPNEPPNWSPPPASFWIPGVSWVNVRTRPGSRPPAEP